MLAAGQKFSRFTILRKLGQGGMGEVYLAEDEKLNRKVALKILLSDYFDSAERMERFDREARMAAQVNHSNVMSIYDVGSAADPETGEELHYIVMEYVEGDSLTKYLGKGKPDLTSTLRLAEKIAAGLAAAHKLNIVHRDIKADNIIIDPEGEPKILDFGLAKPTEPAQMGPLPEGTETISKELTRAGKILGTVSYMSPEQARGEAIDTRSDIFSFGILLYRIVTGKLPFEGVTQVSTLAKILETRHESPRLINENIPPELERIIDKCLEKNPGDRYQDTRDLAVDLRSLRRKYDSGITDTVSTTATVQSRPAARGASGWRRLALLAGGLILAVVVVVVLRDYFSTLKGAVDGGLRAGENSLAILGFENKTGDAELDWLQTGLPEILLTDLSQGQALKLISRERVLDCFDDRDGKGRTHEECMRAAKTLGAATVLSGSYFKLGDKIRIDARLEEVGSGEIVLAEKVVGDDPFTLVDSLTAKIAASLNLQEQAAGHQKVTQFTSSSPEAYKHYLAGMDYFLDEFYEKAIDEFNAALAIDSTFALAYMRIGMAYAFQGQTQAGMAYFATAKEYEGRLPARERSLLDIYADTWMATEYDNAFTKLESFVRYYPDDKEARAIYGIFLNTFTGDTVRAYAQFDTALALDPRYRLALRFYGEMASENGNVDRAIELTKRLLEFYPESPSAYTTLAGYYQSKGELEKARVEYQAAAARFPDIPLVWRRLSQLYIQERMFDSSRYYLERFRGLVEKKPFDMVRYYRDRANLDTWAGKYKSSLESLRQARDQAMLTKDSGQVRSALATLANNFFIYGMSDSALFYAERGFEWSTGFMGLNYPMQLVAWSPRHAEKARPIFQAEIVAFRSRLPSEMWGMADALQKLFEAQCVADTGRLITVLEDIIANQYGGGDMEEDRRSLAHIHVARGEFGKARDVLTELLGQGLAPGDAYAYLLDVYYLGRANEGLGLVDEAVERYAEVLRYWDKADIELKEITDTRARLARLTS
ncbi:MAG: protein kinase [candidate division Zixibacteria bacterium]|nr:protein kinase [candidate division Zixibacteria bacterium]